MGNIQQTISTAQQEVNSIVDYAIFFGVAIVGILLISSMFRFLFGKKAQLGKSITSAMEILCLYVICIVVYSFGLHWDIFLNPLPFVSIEEGHMQVFPILDAEYMEICSQFTKLLIIAFLVNLMNSIIPEGKKLWLWLLLRLGTVILVIFVNYGLDHMLNIWLPQGITDVAPIILLGTLILLILLGSLKMIVGVSLFVANPIIGALYTFFFSNLIGRALARSIVSAGLITALVYLLHSLGIVAMTITATSLLLLIPALIIVILIWYLVDRIV